MILLDACKAFAMQCSSYRNVMLSILCEILVHYCMVSCLKCMHSFCHETWTAAKVNRRNVTSNVSTMQTKMLTKDFLRIGAVLKQVLKAVKAGCNLAVFPRNVATSYVTVWGR